MERKLGINSHQGSGVLLEAKYFNDLMEAIEIRESGWIAPLINISTTCLKGIKF